MRTRILNEHLDLLSCRCAALRETAYLTGHDRKTPALFAGTLPWLSALDLLHLTSPTSAILSAVIFNAVVIPLLVPIALKGVTYRPVGADALLRRNLLAWGLGGVIAPFVGIKLIDLLLAAVGLA